MSLFAHIVIGMPTMLANSSQYHQRKSLLDGVKQHDPMALCLLRNVCRKLSPNGGGGDFW